MRRAVQFALCVLCAPIAAAQNPAGQPAELTAVKILDQPATEVRIEVTTTYAVASPEVVETYRDSLVLELPGTVYRALPRRIQVGRDGIRAVRVWMQSERPAITRIVVEIDRVEQYAVTPRGNTIVLSVGPSLSGLSPADVHTTAEVFGRRTPAAAARGGASSSVVGALTGIFHSKAPKATVYKGPGFENSKQPAPPAGNGASQTASSSGSAGAGSSSPGFEPSSNASASVATVPSTPASQNIGDSLALTAPPDSGKVAANESLGQTLESASHDKVVITPDRTNSLSSALPPQPVASHGEPASTGLNGPAAPNAASAAAAPAATTEPNGAAVEPTGPATPAPGAAVGEVAPEAKTGFTAQPPAAPDAGVPTREVRAVLSLANPGMRTEFHVKFVEEESAYIDGGRSAGLAEGMKLLVKAVPGDAANKPSDTNSPVAELVVIGVAETSAVTEIHKPEREVVPGDIAYLSTESIEALVQQHAVGATRSYPAVISFTESGDALDEEAHAFAPRPPLPSVNHAVGRIGFDYTETKSMDASQINSSSFGGIVRVDFTRIGGSYWNLRGYWRGRFVSTSAASQQQTLQDLINRTYHLALTYENPNSPLVFGVGRMYLPWAVSLETIDGGYFGVRPHHGTILGIFGGSTPDPTSWNYSPNRHLGGAFFNAEGGSFDSFHYSSTVGLGEDFDNVQYSTTTPTGANTLSYADNRPFAFIENTFSHKRSLSLFQALQADRPSSNPAATSPGPGISRSFTTLRIEPVSRVELTANYTYFRDMPTFDPQLIGTGLLDKYLFQGFSGGVRVEPIKKIFLYADLGRSNRTGDAKTSLNQLYGITFGELPKLKVRLDAHYSKFTSAFGAGTYRTFSVSRSIGDRLHFEAIGGDQVFTSSVAGNQNARFFTTNLDAPLAVSFFVQGGFTMYRGQLQNYDQSYVTLGYRFDSKWKHK